MALLTGIALLGGLNAPADAQRQQMPGRILSTTFQISGGVFAVNTDGSNFINLTPNRVQGTLGKDIQPSVSGDGKLVAFASYRNTAPGYGYNTHLWVMNSDGTNPHPITFDSYLVNGDPVYERYPVISPDGKKIAFISNRYIFRYPDGGYTTIPYLYVINTDGTNLHQVTATQFNPQNGYPGGDAMGAAWGPDSDTLVFRGVRLFPIENRIGFHYGSYFIHADGSGESALDVADSTGQFGAIDWSPNGRYVITPYGGEAQGAPNYRVNLYDLVTHTMSILFYNADNKFISAPGSVRFSPDSSQIAYTVPGPNFGEFVFAVNNLSGTSERSIQVSVDRGVWLWWQGGAAIPTPTRLTLSYNVPPDLLLLFTGQPGVQVVPTLYDAQNNVIVHAVGTWDPSEARYFKLDVMGIATPFESQYYGPLFLTATNGGITSNKAKVMVNLPNVQIKLSSIDNYHGTTQAFLAIANPGAGGATNISITSMTLDGVAPNETLPFYYGNVPSGLQSQNLVFTFPISAKPSGTIVLLKVKGTYDYYGTFNTTLRVPLP